MIEELPPSAELTQLSEATGDGMDRSPCPAADLQPFDERYCLGELIGRGGMAEVYLSRDLALDRLVAVKLPRLDWIGVPGTVERFRRESQSVAGLDHTGIVSVLRVGEDLITDPSGTRVHRPYIVMEHVAGLTLQTLVTSPAPLRVDEALRIFADILSVLSYTHEQGVIHGDISATNVMLGTNDEVKLIDFGSSSHVVTESGATMPMSVDATLRYVSPERVQRLAFDTRADVYSAGCLLYQLLTGRTPFMGSSPVDLAYQHVHAAPEPPSTLKPHIGPRLDAVVLRALAKTPDDRYQSAQEFRDALLAAPPGARVVGRRDQQPPPRLVGSRS